MEGQSKTEKKEHKTKHSKKSKAHQNIINHIDNISSAFGVIFGSGKKSNLLNHLNKAIDTCHKNGLVTIDEKRMVKNIFNITETRAQDVMTPRTDIVAVQHDANLEEIKKLIIETEHSRIPVFKRNLDNIIGFIHSKDLAKFISSDSSKTDEEFKINDVLRRVLYIPHSMRITDLLLRMRSSRIHIAIVLDEYGGTDGLVSIEDIVEEIVGEIEDEHDIPDDNLYLRIKKINENTIHIGGRVEIEKIANFLPKELLEEMGNDFDTIGGLIFSLFKKVPEIGETYEYNNYKFRILDADARSVKLVEVTSY